MTPQNATARFTRVRRPIPGTLRDRIVRFYEQNPDEELTHADIHAKFGVTRKNTEQALILLRKEGLLESVHVVRLRRKGIAQESGS